MKKVSAVIPAYNEATCLAQTLQALREHVDVHELLVVDDGSKDDTYGVARLWSDQVIRHPVNQGKGKALQTGWQQATGDIILFLDADLKASAKWANLLLHPVMQDQCDMSVARLPPPPSKAGMGLAKGLARRGIFYLTGSLVDAPLSGQRAIRREVLTRLGKLDDGFGIEVGLTIDALRAGYRIREVFVPFTHRYTGNDWSGICHRGKEFLAIGRALAQKWKEGRNHS